MRRWKRVGRHPWKASGIAVSLLLLASAVSVACMTPSRTTPATSTPAADLPADCGEQPVLVVSERKAFTTPQTPLAAGAALSVCQPGPRSARPGEPIVDPAWPLLVHLVNDSPETLIVVAV